MALSEQLKIAAPPTQTALLPEEAGGETALPVAPGRLGWTGLLFVAVFAFLLASFPARNSDLWTHLVAGRQLAEKLPALGSLFSQLAAGGVAPGWLYDLGVYALYQ